MIEKDKDITQQEPVTAEPQPQQTKSEEPSLQEIIRETVREEDSNFKPGLTLHKVLGGDLLSAAIVRKQIWLLLLICFFIIIYIANRYSYQNNMIEISKLNEELIDAKYKALSTRSQLTERTRQSNILDMLKAANDSTLHIADQPPYLIQVPEQ